MLRKEKWFEVCGMEKLRPNKRLGEERPTLKSMQTSIRKIEIFEWGYELPLIFECEKVRAGGGVCVVTNLLSKTGFCRQPQRRPICQHDSPSIGARSQYLPHQLVKT